jgi:drug/metabolite transporter (DMT)-like permease
MGFSATLHHPQILMTKHPLFMVAIAATQAQRIHRRLASSALLVEGGVLFTVWASQKKNAIGSNSLIC